MRAPAFFTTRAYPYSTVHTSAHQCARLFRLVYLPSRCAALRFDYRCVRGALPYLAMYGAYAALPHDVTLS